MDPGSSFLELLREQYVLKLKAHLLSQNKAVFADMIVAIGAAFLDEDLHQAAKELSSCLRFLYTEKNLKSFYIEPVHIESVEVLLCYCYVLTSGDMGELKDEFEDQTKLMIYILTLSYVVQKGDRNGFVSKHMNILKEYLEKIRFFKDDNINEIIEKRIPEKNENKDPPTKQGKKIKKQKAKKHSSPEGTTKLQDKTEETETIIRILKQTHSNGQINLSVKKEEHYNVLAPNNKGQGNKKNQGKGLIPVKKKDSTTQTDKLKVNNTCIQVNTEEIVESEILRAVLDIKRNMQDSKEKDDQVESLGKKLLEENEKFKQFRAKVAEDNKENQIKHDRECSNFRKTITKLEADLKKHQERLKFANKTVVSELEMQRILISHIFNFYEMKCNQTIDFLKEVKNYVILGYISHSEEYNNFLKIWKENLKKIEMEKSKYLANFDSMEKAVHAGKNYKNIDWPDIQDISNMDIFKSFILSTIKNSAAIRQDLMNVPNHSREMSLEAKQKDKTENRKQPGNLESVPSKSKKEKSKPAVNSSEIKVNNYLVAKAREVAAVTQMKNKEKGRASVSFSERKDFSSASKTNGKVLTCTVTKENENISEKMLYQYLMENTGLSEDNICSVLMTLMVKNKEPICGMPKEQILKEVRKILSFKRDKNPWTNPNAGIVEWHNEDVDMNCSICFEAFSKATSYVLTCRHEFHRKCIETWLHTSSCCPICRVHTVLDEDFPPLS